MYKWTILYIVLPQFSNNFDKNLSGFLNKSYITEKYIPGVYKKIVNLHSNIDRCQHNHIIYNREE